MTTAVAQVGCGYWGPNLLRNLHALPGCRLVAVDRKEPLTGATHARMVVDVLERAERILQSRRK